MNFLCKVLFPRGKVAILLSMPEVWEGHMRISRSQGRFHKIRVDEFFDFLSVKRVGLIILEVPVGFRIYPFFQIPVGFVKGAVVWRLRCRRLCFSSSRLGVERGGLPTRQLFV